MIRIKKHKYQRFGLYEDDGLFTEDSKIADLDQLTWKDWQLRIEEKNGYRIIRFKAPTKGVAWQAARRLYREATK